jgi:DNA-binding NtrC family response regulator
MLSSRQMPSGFRILIVDDEAGMHELLHEMFLSEDYAVDYALSGQEALARIAASHYDLVLTDIRMPGIDGLTLMNRIKDEHPETKVIVMTAQSTPQTVVRAISEKAFSYLGKPFTRASLLDTINSALCNPVSPDDILVVSARSRLDLAGGALQTGHRRPARPLFFASSVSSSARTNGTASLRRSANC